MKKSTRMAAVAAAVAVMASVVAGCGSSKSSDSYLIGWHRPADRRCFLLRYIR